MRKSLLVIALAAALGQGCSLVQPNHDRPAQVLPENWGSTVTGSQMQLAGEQWWTLFNDPVLNALVTEAMQHNHDVEAAAARVVEAEASLGVTEADRYPTVVANGGANRKQISKVTAMPLYSGMSREQNDYLLTLNASYEVDVWGKYRRASDAARAQLLAAQYGRETVLLTLTADVAQQYFNLLAADAQVATLQDVLKTRQETLDLLQVRLKNGLSSEYDVHQAEAEEAAVRSQLSGALKAQENLESVLAILLGRSPRDVMSGKVARGNVAAMNTLWVPDGLPSDLLLRRPDIRQAEQQLVAEDARIDVARTDYFPTISLTGYLGVESATMAKLFTGPAGIYQFALGLAQPIFNAKRLDFSVRATQAHRDQALAAYQKAVASAFGDVRNALNAQATARTMLQAETERIKALEETQRLANVRYEGGVAGRLEVLDADRQLLQAKLSRIDAENTQRAAVVSLFKALGGGWKADVAASEPARPVVAP
jgi:multidrug efflux system outer membrane protein